MENFFATCPRGLEPLLAEELHQFKAEKIHAVGGGVGFSGDFLLCYRVNLESRIASRVLWQVSGGGYRNEDDIYRAAYSLPWTDWFDPVRTIRVDVSATKSPLTSLNFVTLKIKDAVCDKIRRLSGRRPDVDTRRPDIPIQGHLTDRDFTLYLDTTGSLFKRGQRIATGEAPLRENLAAGILRLAGWVPHAAARSHVRQRHDLLSGVYGSRCRARTARHFTFEKLKNFDARRWRSLATERARQKPKVPLEIHGSDLSARRARKLPALISWRRTEKVVSLKRANVLEISAPAKEGIIVTNPPYGVRLGEQQSLAEFTPSSATY
jgi:putative N6-adenine-specific DNA methylase